jgi:hypothetical protein
MDMLKVLKIRSVENAVYTRQYNRMRFKIPADNLNTHLEDSYLSFQVVPVTAAGVPVAPEVNVAFGAADGSTIYYPTSLLKIARIFRGDSNVPLEEINKLNLIDLNLKIYQKDTENNLSDQYENGNIISNIFQGDKSSFWLEGQADIHIYLKDIFGLCKNKDFYLSDTAGLQMEFELEDQYSLFIENIADESNQMVYTALSNTNVVQTPLSTLNNDFVSSTLPGVSSNLFSADTISNQQLVDMNSPLENFYVALNSSIDFNWGTYDATNKRISIAIAINTNTVPLYGNGEVFTAFGINDLAGNNILKNSNFPQIPLELVYKTTTSQTEDLKSLHFDFTTQIDIDMSGSTVTTPAILNGFIPWNSATAPTFIPLAIASASSLSIRATNRTWYPLTYVNDISGAIPAQFSNLTGSFNDMITNDGGAITLTPGTSTNAPTITITEAALGSGITFNLNCLHTIHFDEVNTGTTWVPLVKTGDNNINLMKTLEFVSSKNKLLFKATGARVLELVGYGANQGAINTQITKLLNRVLFPTTTVGTIVFRQISGPVTGLLGSEIQAADLTYEIPRAEVVLIQSSKKAADSPPKVYSTWKMEPTLIEYGTQMWQHQFILEPNTYNAMLLYPEQVSNGEQSMASATDSLATYRWAIDNIDNTNRDVAINQALHRDKLIDTFNNSDMKLKSLFAGDSSIIPIKVYTGVDNENMYMNNQTHTLQVTLKAGLDDSGAQAQLVPKNLYLFKQILKTL